MLCYAMCVTVNIIFIHFNIWHEIHRQTCLAPEGTRKSISGPRPKKVVHHCFRVTTLDRIMNNNLPHLSVLDRSSFVSPVQSLILPNHLVYPFRGHPCSTLDYFLL